MISQGCGLPNEGQHLLEQRGGIRACEWIDDGEKQDARCFCKGSECNTKDLVLGWHLHGGECKNFSFLSSKQNEMLVG